MYFNGLDLPFDARHGLRFREPSPPLRTERLRPSDHFFFLRIGGMKQGPESCDGAGVVLVSTKFHFEMAPLRS